MKKAFGFFFVAASLALASSAQAQQLHLKATVPFDFVIGTQAFPAGDYDIQNATQYTLVIDNGSEKGRRLVMPLSATSQERAKNSVLVFHRVGDSYYLYQIWIQGNTLGREFVQPKAEMRLARNGAKAEDVKVAATLIH